MWWRMWRDRKNPKWALNFKDLPMSNNDVNGERSPSPPLRPRPLAEAVAQPLPNSLRSVVACVARKGSHCWSTTSRRRQPYLNEWRREHEKEQRREWGWTLRQHCSHRLILRIEFHTHTQKHSQIYMCIQKTCVSCMRAAILLILMQKRRQLENLFNSTKSLIGFIMCT